MESFDLIIIGGGVIGCAIARAALLAMPSLSLALIESESDLSMHQSGRNSGVTHVGYNQKPGTLKAKLVVSGSARLKDYCRKHGVAVVEDGIAIVASCEEQTETLHELARRGQANGAVVEVVDKKRLSQLEPNAAGVAALWAPQGASFDARGYVLSLAREARELGAQIFLGETVKELRETTSWIEVETDKRLLRGKALVNAAGVMADRLAHKLGVGLDYQIIPFKGGYWELIPERRPLVRAHIYPAPNLAFPFLGVHLSRTFDGKILVGPGAVLACGRKAYGRFDFDLLDLAEMFGFEGFWKLFSSKDFCDMARKEWEKTFFASAVLKEAQSLVPELRRQDIIISRSGIRAQLVSRQGKMVDDLTIEQTARTLHILNAVSPALTCSLPFADNVVSLITPRLCQNKTQNQALLKKS